jgi:hypothetical protein
LIYYRATLWSKEQAKEVMTPLTQKYVDVLITTIEDMAMIYDIGCGQYSAKHIIAGDINQFEDNDIQIFARSVIDLLGVKIIAITIRYPDSFEEHRWESAAMDTDGNYFRSPTKIESSYQIGWRWNMKCGILLWSDYQ